MRWVMGWWRGSAWRKLAPQRVPLVVGPLALDVVGHRVLIGGHVVHLPARETAILEVLMRNPGRVISGSELARAIGEHAGRDRQVTRWVRRLARRLALSPPYAPLVESVPHAGYRYLPIASPGHNSPDL
ncbi:MAG TPA: winged helix-turn-helix domain-containing protein [Pseudonocardiaceae bacterium]|nr:winged helix-turn-helix domain-containing protein [Pseudonocardiaceae bacterium]